MERKFILHYVKEFLNLLIEDIGNWYSTATYYAKCDVISGQNKKIQIEISHQQSVGAQKYKRTCIKAVFHFSRIVAKRSVFHCLVNIQAELTT